MAPLLLKRPPLQHDFSHSKLHDLYDELRLEVNGTPHKSNSYYLRKFFVFFFSLLFVVGGFGGFSFRPSRGVSVLKTGVASSKPKKTAPINSNNQTLPVNISNMHGQEHELELIVHEAKRFGKQSRILALGGSTTSGSTLENPRDAFPRQLAQLLGVHWEVMNVATRATDASYTSQCIESVIKDVATDVDDMVKDFDVILIEYSLNGLDGLKLLLKRLRRRYPGAIIIYVHLWSLRSLIENTKTGAKPREILLDRSKSFEEAEQGINAMIHDPTAEWKYSEGMVHQSRNHFEAARAAVLDFQGVAYELPMPNIHDVIHNGWFGPNSHHLSKVGHQQVAKALYELVRRSDNIKPSASEIVNLDHTWGKGDQCYSWFETGKSPVVKFSGGTMQMFAKPDKWALQIGDGYGHPATIWFENNSEDPQPLRLEIMSWGPNIYPKTLVQLNGSDQKLSDTNSLSVDPVHPVEWQRNFHIPRSVYIGNVQPGKNSVTIDTLEVKDHPFRVTGLVMCGACQEMDGLQTPIVAKGGSSEVPIVDKALVMEREVHNMASQGTPQPQQVTIDEISKIKKRESLLKEQQQLMQPNTKFEATQTASVVTNASVSVRPERSTARLRRQQL